MGATQSAAALAILEAQPALANSNETKECSICRDDIPVANWPTSTPTKTCTHQVDTCKSCMAMHIEQEVHIKGQTIDVRCPMVACGKHLDFKDVEKWANPDVFKRYDLLVLRRVLQADKDFRWCKRSGCGSGQIHSSGAARPMMICFECHARSCFTHDVPWHDGISCKDFTGRVRTNVDAATQTYLARVAKPCPNCNKTIEKSGGCDHMTCKLPGGCGHEFCWLCLAPWNDIAKRGNQHHRPTCQLHEQR